eukprot:5087177-Pleurochrysis_carterae.AAC.1
MIVCQLETGWSPLYFLDDSSLTSDIYLLANAPGAFKGRSRLYATLSIYLCARSILVAPAWRSKTSLGNHHTPGLFESQALNASISILNIEAFYY